MNNNDNQNIILLLIFVNFIIITLFVIHICSFNINFNKFNKDDIIITASTSPKRLNEIEKIIDNLLNKQTIKPTKFFLNVPYKFKRTGQTYSNEILNNLRNKFDRLQINRCEDIGPITKVSNTLNLVKNPDVTIIIVDDDTEYPNDFIENLIKKLNNIDNNNVIANSIYENKINKTGIDIIEGFKGICFKRKIFDDDFNDFIKKSNDYVHCYKSDDYVISRYLKNKNVNFVKPDVDFKINQYDYGFEDDALHKQDNIEHKERYNFCKKYIDKL